jgi:hypothetical protein
MEAWRARGSWIPVANDIPLKTRNGSPAALPCHTRSVTFVNDKKDKVLGTGIIKVNDHFTLNYAALVDKLTYNLLTVSQLVDANFDVLFRKSGSRVLDSSGKLVCGISRIAKVFLADFSFTQSFVKCLIS